MAETLPPRDCGAATAMQVPGPRNSSERHTQARTTDAYGETVDTASLIRAKDCKSRSRGSAGQGLGSLHTSAEDGGPPSPSSPHAGLPSTCAGTPHQEAGLGRSGGKRALPTRWSLGRLAAREAQWLQRAGEDGALNPLAFNSQHGPGLCLS